MFAMNWTTGELIHSKESVDFTVYAFSDQAPINGSVLVWIEIDEKVCEHTYGFANYHLKNGTIDFIACIPKKVVDDEMPNMAAFSSNDKFFATGSGNSETGDLQLLIFDAQTGEVKVNTDLPGLKKALGVSEIAPFIDIWGLGFMNIEKEIGFLNH